MREKVAPDPAASAFCPQQDLCSPPRERITSKGIHMTDTHSVQTCRWATPTLFLPWPLWFAASQHEWSCQRGIGVSVLPDPAICRTCSCWSRAQPERKPAPVS
jgi:hypothetical protein